jgi:hypothetical protein
MPGVASGRVRDSLDVYAARLVSRDRCIRDGDSGDNSGETGVALEKLAAGMQVGGSRRTCHAAGHPLARGIELHSHVFAARYHRDPHCNAPGCV